ncbi:MAG TPA: hypothetical protein DCP24_02625 [Nitrospiraceae bacterium]|nr:hypothetical protein [Nitrospiraceae bacterium]
MIEKFKAKTVLDVGCGPAFKLNRLIAPHVEQFVGIDQKSAIEYAKQTYNAGHYLDVDLDRISDFENEPLLSQKYDFIIHAAVIEHLKEPDQLLSFIKRRMTLASHLLISTCDRDRVRGIHNMMSPKPEHVREWNAHEFYAYMVQSGFKVVKFVYLPPNRLTKDDFWKETNKWMWKGDGRCLFYEMAFLCRLSE